MCDGRVVAAVAGFFLTCEHVVEFELTRAGPQHQEPLTGREGTAHEAALILVSLPEHGDGAEPGQKETDGVGTSGRGKETSPKL